MREFVDLHTHSTASDGQLSPQELIAHADAARLAAIALTDHDTLAGLAAAREAAEAYPELTFVGGLEISAKFPNGTLHILAYGTDETAPSLIHITEQFRAARNQRNPKILANLRTLGLEIDMSDVLAVAKRDSTDADERIVSRVHIAEALRRKDYVRNAQEAFDKYLGQGAAAYEDKEVIEPADAIAAIHDADALAVLAHPIQLKYENHAQLERILRDLIDKGIDGIEAYHTEHAVADTRLYLDLAKKYNLGITGGSDFHGASKPDVALGRPRVPLGAISKRFQDRLFART